MVTVAPITRPDFPRNVRLFDDEHPVFHVEQIRDFGQNGRPSEKRFRNHPGVGQNGFVVQPGFWIRGRTIRSPGLQIAKRPFLDGVGANGMVRRIFPNCRVFGVVHELPVRVDVDAETIGVRFFYAVHLVGWFVVAVVFPGFEIGGGWCDGDVFRLCHCTHQIKRRSLYYVLTVGSAPTWQNRGTEKTRLVNMPTEFVLFIHLTNARLPARVVALFFCPHPVGY